MFAFRQSDAPKVQLERMWARDDKNGDGVISFEEFDGYKGIGNSNNMVERGEFISFMLRNMFVGDLTRHMSVLYCI